MCLRRFGPTVSFARNSRGFAARTRWKCWGVNQRGVPSFDSPRKHIETGRGVRLAEKAEGGAEIRFLMAFDERRAERLFPHLFACRIRHHGDMQVARLGLAEKALQPDLARGG